MICKNLDAAGLSFCGVVNALAKASLFCLHTGDPIPPDEGGGQNLSGGGLCLQEGVIPLAGCVWAGKVLPVLSCPEQLLGQLGEHQGSFGAQDKDAALFPAAPLLDSS